MLHETGVLKLAIRKMNYQFLKKKRERGLTWLAPNQQSDILLWADSNQGESVPSDFTQSHREASGSPQEREMWRYLLNYLGLKHRRKTIKWDQWIWKSLETECHKHAGPAPIQSRCGIRQPLEGSSSRWWLLANASIKTNQSERCRWDRKGDCKHRLASISIAQKNGGPLAQNGRKQAWQADRQTF